MIDRFNVLVQHTAGARARARERLMGSIGGDASARAVSRDEDAVAARARAQAEVAALVDTVARRERELVDVNEKIARARRERAKSDARKRREDVAAARLEAALDDARARRLTERRAAHDAWTRRCAQSMRAATNATPFVASATVRRDFHEKSLALANALATAADVVV